MKQDRAMDDAKRAHMHRTPQMEQIERLQEENQKLRTENLNLKEKLLIMKAENNTMRARWVEQQERIDECDNKKIQSLKDKINEQRLKINRLLYYFPF